MSVPLCYTKASVLSRQLESVQKEIARVEAAVAACTKTQSTIRSEEGQLNRAKRQYKASTRSNRTSLDRVQRKLKDVRDQLQRLQLQAHLQAEEGEGGEDDENEPAPSVPMGPRVVPMLKKTTGTVVGFLPDLAFVEDEQISRSAGRTNIRRRVGGGI